MLLNFLLFKIFIIHLYFIYYHDLKPEPNQGIDDEGQWPKILENGCFKIWNVPTNRTYLNLVI